MRGVFVGALLLAGCGGSAAGTPPAVEFPTMLALHQTAIVRSCGPSEGVCHNNREYPDLHTPANLLAAIGAPCNPGREARDIFDGCEPKADELVVEAIGLRAPIAVFGQEEWSNEEAALFRRFALEAPVPEGISSAARIERAGAMLIDLGDHVSLEPGAQIGRITKLQALEYRTLESIRAGDPNRNGVTGAKDPWALIMPGAPERSYLVGRLEGTVPGDRMPRANQPLTPEELAALRCWIATLSREPSARDEIDYAACEI